MITKNGNTCQDEGIDINDDKTDGFLHILENVIHANNDVRGIMHIIRYSEPNSHHDYTFILTVSYHW